MNQIVFVMCVFVAGACNAQGPHGPMGEQFKEYLESCKTATGLTDDEVKGFMSHNGTPSDKNWCMIACMKKKMGVMDASNKIDVNKSLEAMAGMKQGNPELFAKISEALPACKTEMESVPANLANECTAAKVFETCMKNKGAAHH